MRTLINRLTIMSFCGFLMLVISLLIPGWVILDANLNQMAALMNNMPVEIQQHYKALQQQQADMVKQHPEMPVPKYFSFRCGPFFIKYCMVMVTGGIYRYICGVMSPGAIISMLNMLAGNTTKGTNGQVADMMDSMESSVWTVTSSTNGQVANMTASIQSSSLTVASIIRGYIAIIVLCALGLIQSFVSLVLSIVYVCIRHPQKRLEIAGSVSSFLSGSIMILIPSIFLSVYIIKEPFGDVGSFSVPYSISFCFSGIILVLDNAIMFIRITCRSKEPYKYEMMVIDTSKGSGGTYVAKT